MWCAIILWILGGYMFVCYWDEVLCEYTDSLFMRILGRIALFALWPVGVIVVFILGLFSLRFLEDEYDESDEYDDIEDFDVQ